MKRMEKSIVKKVEKKLEKAFRETRKMMEEMTPTHDKYKNMIVNMEHIKDPGLLKAWDHLQKIESKKDAVGRYLIPCHFHENFSGNFFKFLVFQQEHKHSIVPNNPEHKSLSNWLKNQRNYMRDFENKTGDNNYTRFPDYYYLMTDCSLMPYKY
jgi:hypothetical protein